MKVLLLNGSPHKAGTTAAALSQVESALHKNKVDTEWFHLGSGTVHGCTACGHCNNHDTCVFTDDSANELIQRITAADALVVGSPVYYAGPNGALCALLDRVFFVAGPSFRGKPAAAVAVCRRGGATAALDRLQKYFTISSMPLVSSDYWNIVHGHNAQQAAQDEEGMQVMRLLGENMAWVLRGAQAAGAPPAPEEKKAWTNFIR